MNTLFALALVHLTQLFGGNLGWAIVTFSFGLRVALLPLTVRLARRARRHQEIARALQPEIEELKKRYSAKPERMFAEMRKLHQKHKFNPLDLPMLIGNFVQLPLFAMVYRSIRVAVASARPFLWIRSLASPDGAITLIILTLTAATAYWMPGASEHARSTMIVIQLLVTSLIVWKLAAGLGLYWLSSNLVGLFQTLWLRYREPTRLQMA